MAYYVREPRGAIGRLYRADGLSIFTTSAPLVMHDECAHVPEIAGDPWVDQRASWNAREAFTASMGTGFDLCWGPVYSLDPVSAPDCYVCSEQVIGRG